MLEGHSIRGAENTAVHLVCQCILMGGVLSVE